MCNIVTKGFAGVKLSGVSQVVWFFFFRVNSVRAIMVNVNPEMSLTVKYGWNGITSVFLFNTRG